MWSSFMVSRTESHLTKVYANQITTLQTPFRLPSVRPGQKARVDQEKNRSLSEVQLRNPTSANTSHPRNAFSLLWILFSELKIILLSLLSLFSHHYFIIITIIA